MSPRLLAVAGGADFGDVFRGDGWGGIAPFAADVGEDVGDVAVLELRPRRHGIVVALAFDLDRALHAGEEDFHQVVIADPISPDDPFTGDERRELSSHAHAAGLVADDAVLGEEAFPDDFGIGRGGWGSCASPGEFGVVNIGLEATAVAGEVKSAPENKDSCKNDEPKGNGGGFLGGLGGFTQNGSGNLSCGCFARLVRVVRRRVHCVLLGGCDRGFRERVALVQGKKVGGKGFGLLGGNNFVAGLRSTGSSETEDCFIRGLTLDFNNII